MSEDFPWDMLDRYFSGQCTAEEEARIRAWAAADAERARMIASARHIWEKSEPHWQRFDVDAAWATVRGRIAPSGAARSGGTVVPLRRTRSEAARRQRRPLRATGFVGVAAAIAIIAVAVARFVMSEPDRVEPLARSFATEIGQRSEVLLDDGSRVVLSAATRIRVPDTYGQNARDVYLDQGEAFFEVEHDSSKPFRVYAAGIVAEDLGTEFLIQAPAGDSTVQVVVASGEVGMHADEGAPDGNVTLSPGQLGRARLSGSIAVDSTADVAAHLAWMHGRPAFDEAPLRRVLGDLERWFGVPIRLSDPALSSVVVTANFEDQSFGEILQTLSAALDLEYRRTAGGIVLLVRRP